MTEQIPTPTPEQVQQWLNHLTGDAWRRTHTTDDFLLAACAAEWGANRELDACCEWIANNSLHHAQSDLLNDLRAARRPKLPISAEQALETVTEMANCMKAGFIPKRSDLDLIRRALERLQELEGQGDD